MTTSDLIRKPFSNSQKQEFMVEMTDSSSSSTMSGVSSSSLDRTKSVGDIADGNFVSFSPSDMYSKTNAHRGGVNENMNHEISASIQIINEESFETLSDLPQYLGLSIKPQCA